MIDEAQHLGKIPSGRRLLDQLDVIKSIANQTKTVHVLFGTYDLLAFRNLNGQLSRRSIDVHLARYRAEDSEDRQTFINVVQSFEKELPFEDSVRPCKRLGVPVRAEPWLRRHFEGMAGAGCYRSVSKGWPPADESQS